MWKICTCKQEKQALQMPYHLKLRHKNGGNMQTGETSTSTALPLKTET